MKHRNELRAEIESSRRRWKGSRPWTWRSPIAWPPWRCRPR